MGRRGRADVEYAALAALYVDTLAAGAGVPDLADRLHLSEKTVRNQLHQARQRGLLTDAPRGRSGGDLTDRARQLLEEET